MAEINSDIEIVTKAHYKDLTHYLTNFEDETRDEQFWKSRLYYWWDQNPAFTGKFERGWVLIRKDNKKIVGFIGLIPTLFQLQGNNIIVLNITTWRVNNKYRHQSLSLLFKALSYSKQTILFNTTPSKGVIDILKALKFSHFPSLIKRNYFTILNPYKILKYRRKHGKFLLFLVMLMSPPIRLYQFLRLTIIYKKNIVKRKYNVNKEFDKLWECTRDLYGKTNVRQSDVIQWYCFSNKYLKKILFGYYVNNELQSYAIYNEVLSKNIKRLICADIWGINIDKLTIKTFCHEAYKYGINNEVDIIEYPSYNNQLTNKYQSAGLFWRKALDIRYFKTGINGLELQNREDAHLTYQQGDIGL